MPAPLSSEPRRVAVTGMGAVTGAGVGVSALLDGVHKGRSYAAPFAAELGDESPTGFAVRVPDFDAPAGLSKAERRRYPPVLQFAVVAAAEATAQAGLGEDTMDKRRAAIVMGTGMGGLQMLLDQAVLIPEKGWRGINPLTVPMTMPNAIAAVLAERYGFQGPALCISLACASGASAIAEGARLIRDGSADVVLAGGAESLIDPFIVGSFARADAMSNERACAAHASRPFDRDRDGFLMAEGAAVVVLESFEHAQTRNAKIFGEVAGWAQTCDAFHLVRPNENPEAIVDCMTGAIQLAGLTPAEVRQVNAHGTSTPLNDPIEAMAIEAVFGAAAPPVTSVKGSLGHAIGAAGAIEAVVALACATEGWVPPTANTANVDQAINVDVVLGDARPHDPGPVLSNSFAFGGHNVSLVLAPGTHRVDRSSSPP